MIYGYCRISTSKQNIERQIRNILTSYPKAEIWQETYTGTKTDGRKKFEQLLKTIRSMHTGKRKRTDGQNYQKLFI